MILGAVKKAVLIAVIVIASVLYWAVSTYASDISSADSVGTVRITNNSTAATGVSTVFTLNTTSLIANGRANADLTSTAMLSHTGGEVAYMPGRPGDPWVVFVSAIGNLMNLDFKLYTASDGDMEGKIAYFPDDEGMSVADNTTLEFSDNGSISITGRFDTSVNGVIIEKIDAYHAVTGSGNVTERILSSTQNVTALTADSTWRPRSLAGSIGADATGVILEVVDTDGVVSNLGFRKTGSTDDRRATGSLHMFVYVGVNAAGSFDYWLSDADQHVYLRAYTTSEWTFNTNGTVKSPGASGAWTNIDCSADVPAGTEAVILEANCTVANTAFGARKNGSTDARTTIIQVGYKIFAVVGLDASRIYQAYEGTDAQITQHIVGYITDGMTVFTNAIDKSITTTGAFTDVDCSANVSEGSDFVILEILTTAGTDKYAARRNGGARDVYERTTHQWAMVELGRDGIYEEKIETAAGDAYLSAFTTSGVYAGFINSASASKAVAAGEFNLRLYADSVNLGISIDGGATTTTALAGASITDVSTDWAIAPYPAVVYMESCNITKGGNPAGSWDWEYGATFTDGTGNGNTGTPSFRTTSSDADVTAELVSFGPISQAIADNITAAGDNQMTTDVPGEPEDMWGPTGDIGLFFAGPINSILDKCGIPQQAFWYPVVFVFIYLVGMALYKIKSTFFKAIIIGVVMFFFARVNIYGDYIMIFYVCDTYGIVIMSKHFSW